MKGRQPSREDNYTYRPLGQPAPYTSYRVPVEGYESGRFETGRYGSGAQGGVGQAAGTMQQKAGQAANSAQATASSVADQVQSKAGDLADATRDTVQQAGQQVQTQAQQVQGTFQRLMQDNPLALGAVALALGAAVGLAIPETQQEHQLMGPARDTLVDRTQTAAQDTVQKVQSVASTAKDAAQQAAQQEAQRQGLTQDNATASQGRTASKGNTALHDNVPPSQAADPTASI